jgi:hypothetical protein
MEAGGVLIHFHEKREIPDPAFTPERLPYSRAVVYVRLVFGDHTNERGIHLSPVSPLDDVMQKELKNVVNHHLRRSVSWLRRFGLSEKQTEDDMDPVPSPVAAPLATTAKKKIEELGFNGLARYSQYLTEIDPALVLDIAYAMHRAEPRSIEPNPIKQLSEWRQHWLGSSINATASMDLPGSKYVSLREILALKKRGESEQGIDATTSILATIMRAGVGEFQPRRRILAWKTRDEESKLGKGLSISAPATVRDPIPWLLEYVLPALDNDKLAVVFFVLLCGLEIGPSVQSMIGAVDKYSSDDVSAALEIAIDAIRSRRLPEC